MFTRKHAKTLSEIDSMVRAEHMRVKERAATQKETPKKVPGRPQDPSSGSKKSGPGSSSIIVVDGNTTAVQGEGDEKSPINILYIFWGFSQKIQIAGVSRSVSSSPHVLSFCSLVRAVSVTQFMWPSVATMAGGPTVSPHSHSVQDT